MNQILVTKKLYITPELKRKKKIYKFDFILSIFLVIVLISVYIYAENDRNKNEEVSQEILAEMRDEQQTQDDSKDSTVANNKDVLVIVLDDENGEYGSVNASINNQPTEAVSESNEAVESEIKTTWDGYNYRSVAIIDIPCIGVNYPILEGETMSVEETDSLLKISPCKFWGPNVNEVGNYCIVGHNYRNSKFFSHVPELEPGDTFTIEEPNVRTLTYEVYDKYTVAPENVSCTSQVTGGRKEVTLITCTNDSSARVIIKAREVK
ncbi:MAG: sortase [Clostridia bacterium]|nr:sortase [Clostridia bacterium]